LTQAAVLKRRVWVSSILFAQLAPSMFVPGRFCSLRELTRYIRSLVTLVTPDPNTMLRVAGSAMQNGRGLPACAGQTKSRE
jgi:hypothetical protein